MFRDILMASASRGGSGTANTYVASAVTFDGTNDYLARAADLTGLADGKAGLISVWLKFAAAGDGASQMILGSNQGASTARFGLQRLAGNLFGVRGRNATGTAILARNSTTNITSASGWVHVIASWNLATPVCQIYVNNVDDQNPSGTLTNDTIDYTTGNAFVGADSGAAAKLNADVADLWFNPTYLDLSVDANRALFIKNGRPVNPTVPVAALGTPCILLSGNAAAFATNQGSGLGLTTTGALTNAATSP